MTVCLPKKINVSYCLAWWVRSHLAKGAGVFCVRCLCISSAMPLTSSLPILQPGALNERRLGRKGQMNLQYLCCPAKGSQKNMLKTRNLSHIIGPQTKGQLLSTETECIWDVSPSCRISEKLIPLLWQKRKTTINRKILLFLDPWTKENRVLG